MADVRFALLCEDVWAEPEGIRSIINLIKALGERDLPWETTMYWALWVEGVPKEIVTIHADILFHDQPHFFQRVRLEIPKSGHGELKLKLGPLVFSEPGEYKFRVGFVDTAGPFETTLALKRLPR